jgi:Fe-S-cluster containining protein
MRLAPWGAPPALRPLHPDQLAAVYEVYARVDAALESASASCRACGECCRFGPDRPVLFASALELGVLVASAGPPAAERPVALAEPGGPDAPWRCPYQEGPGCTARAGRPLGCRTYFCDPEARARGEEVHAEAMGEIREIAARRKSAWWYGPARFYFASHGAASA